MKKYFYIFVAVLLCLNITMAQERMAVKPEGFNPHMLPVVPQVNVPVAHSARVIKTDVGTFLVTPNIRIVPTSGNQTELSATIWTSNPNYVFIGANSDPGQGYYYTTNGGITWGGGDQLPGSVFISSDPACAYDLSGRIHFNYFDNIMVSDRSTNGGVSWLGRVTVPSSSSFDKNHNTVDNNPSSPYSGRVYVVWSNFSLGSPPIVLSYSTNNGASYSSMQQIGQPLSGHYEQGCNIQVGPTGEVYCIWATPITSNPYTEDHIGYTKSTNGGVNWSTPTTPLTINGIRGNILSTNIRVNSFPSMAVDRSGGARNGYVYITWAQRNLAPAGSDADICFSSSSNGGSSWSSPIRVNDDALNNGKQQFFPWMTVDQATGNIAIVFYDTRDNNTSDSCNTYIAYSTNGGTSFINLRASDHSQRPAPLSGYASGYYGDYIGIAAHNNIIWPFWMDNRNGPAQVYTAKITLGPPAAHDISCGPFLSLPSLFLINTQYSIKTQVTNLGSSNETNVPIKFFINGSLINTSSININSGQIDSVSNNWTPASAGNYTLMYVSALATDTNRYNDTVRTIVTVYSTPPPLCEGFSSGQFPPQDWSIIYSGTNYWSQASVSAWCLGANSAKFDFYDAPSSTQQSLITKNFPATTGNTDSLVFMDAYATYTTENDQLQLSSSTDNGTTWTILVTLNGGVSGELVTAPPQTSQFTPTCTQWKRQVRSVPIGTNKLKFTAISAYGNNLYLDSICVVHPVGVNPLANMTPRTYSLSQNYPNPFNPVTSIKYSIPKQGLVRMIVYDILGREVTVLVNEVKPAGNYEVKFDASAYASGVYFYRLESGNFVDSKKMLIVK